MAAVEVLERGSFKAGPVSKCEGCPFAGGCTSCPMRTPTKEASVLKFSSLESLTSLKKLPVGTIFFNAIGEPLVRLREKICSMCQEAASICGHSKSKTSALAAA